MAGMNRRQMLGKSATAGITLAAVRATPARSDIVSVKRNMHLGLVTYNVAKDWDFDTLLAHFKAAGIEGVEFRTTHKHGVEPEIGPDKRREIRQKLADSGLLQVSLGTICEFQSPDPAIVRQNIATCARFIQLAQEIGARGVKVRPNGLPNDVPGERTLDQIGTTLRQCGMMGAEHGVEIWMEVHGSGTQIPASARRIMDFCGHPNVGVTWNSNATDVANGSVKESFELLRPFIRCCHINDLWGDYPYRELFHLLNESGYDRFTLCEVGASIRPEDGITFLKCYRGLWNELSR